MQLNLEHIMQQFAASQSLDITTASRFSAQEFREGIQWLVTQDQTSLALALADAGLSFFPQCEDILAIAGLLAMTQENWSLAVELLQDLCAVQQEAVRPMTYQMLARSLCCNLDPAEAQRVLARGLEAWPNDAMLLAEQQAIVPTENAIAATDCVN